MRRGGGETVNLDEDMFKNHSTHRTPSRIQSRLETGLSRTSPVRTHPYFFDRFIEPVESPPADVCTFLRDTTTPTVSGQRYRDHPPVRNLFESFDSIVAGRVMNISNAHSFI